MAEIVNPALQNFGDGGTASAPGFLTTLVVTIWRVFLILGGLGVLIFLIIGGATWLTSGGDKTKVEAARNRIINALIGMTILFAVIAIVSFIGPAIGFDILKFDLPNNLNPDS